MLSRPSWIRRRSFAHATFSAAEQLIDGRAARRVIVRSRLRRIRTRYRQRSPAPPTTVRDHVFDMATLHDAVLFEIFEDHSEPEARLEDIFRLLANRTRILASRLVGRGLARRYEPEDFSQEALISILRNVALEFCGLAQLDSFLKEQLRYKVLDAGKRDASLKRPEPTRQLALDENLSDDHSDRDPLQCAIATDLMAMSHRLIEKVIDQSPTRRRRDLSAVILTGLADGRTHQELANTLGVSDRTIVRHIQGLRTQLHRALGHHPAATSARPPRSEPNRPCDTESPPPIEGLPTRHALLDLVHRAPREAHERLFEAVVIPIGDRLLDRASRDNAFDPQFADRIVAVIDRVCRTLVTGWSASPPTEPCSLEDLLWRECCRQVDDAPGLSTDR